MGEINFLRGADFFSGNNSSRNIERETDIINNYGTRKNKLDRKILLILVRNYIFIILLYVFYDLFITNKFDRLKDEAFSFILFSVCYYLLSVHFTHTIKRVVTLISVVSVTFGFFVLGGIFGVTSLDIAVLILVVPVIFKGNERRIFFLVILLQIILLSYIQAFHPEFICDYGANDPVIVNIVEILSRFASITYVVYTYKKLYDKEQSLVYETGRNLEIANRRIAIYNKNLQKIISKRTKTIQKLNETLIEYAFFNSHKIRGPLARILGLVYLIKLSCSTNRQHIPCEIIEYINRLTESSLELDIAIKEINLLLEKGDESSTGKDKYYTFE